MADALEAASTEVLLIHRENLLKGLDKVAEHVENGTLDEQPEDPHANPARAGGTFTLLLLMKVNEILDKRGIDPQW